MKFVLYIYVLGQFLKYTDHIQSKFMDSTTSSYPNTCNSLRHKHLYTYDPFHLTLAPTYYSKTSHRRRTAYSVIQCMDSYDDHYSFGRANVCFDRSLALCFSQIETGFINCHLRGYLYSWVCVCACFLYDNDALDSTGADADNIYSMFRVSISILLCIDQC